MEEIALLSYLEPGGEGWRRLTASQGQREVTLASRSLANAELGVIAGVIQGGSVGGHNRQVCLV